ncbi:MAG TPA: T9SS type A sorting domain-containing protein, partial [Puia sp.]|nr:T9SS type A sorting domain-containing protein [Puia sp.]
YRLRNVTVAPTGDTLFIAVDNSCCTLGPTGAIGNSVASPAKGFILRMIYLQPLSLADSSHKVVPPAHRQDSTIRVYPNPAHGILYVDTPPRDRKPWLTQLYTVTGQLIATQESYQDHFTVSTQNIQPGIYILRISDGIATTTTRKVLIAK